MKNRPQISDEEIGSFMDFDRLMARAKSMPRKNNHYSAPKYWVPLLVLTGIALWWFLSSPLDQKHEPSPNAQVEEPQQGTADVEIHPEIRKDDAADQNENKTEDKRINERLTAERKKVQDSPKQTVIVENKSGYVQAEPVEGYPSLYAYFNAQLVYPEESVRDSIEGVETVSFVIDAQGKPENIEVKQSLGKPFENEARRLVENMPPWKPATLNGSAVPSRMSIPLTFQIRKVLNKVN